jgi:UDP-N-acetylmuramoyl-tripeptide--D-alanyl-D-alanine ligase
VSALWTSDEVARALAAGAITAPFAANGVAFDSRAVVKGDLFFALGGETTDGHGFVADAIGRGAVAAVVSRDVGSPGGTLVRVPDTMKALVDLGRAARGRSKARIASVTGSVGKTSTKDALRATLSAQASTSASVASFNNHVGVPISLARLPREARYGVFEIGMNNPGEIEPLARRRRSSTRRPACSPAWPRVRWRYSIETVITTSGWPGMPAVSAFCASSASGAASRPTRGFSPATCKIRAAMLSP